VVSMDQRSPLPLSFSLSERLGRVGFLIVLVLAGCGSVPERSPTDDSSSTWGPQILSARVAQLERIEISVPGILLVNPDHHLASYDQVMIDPILVTFAPGSQKLTSAESRRLESDLRDATSRILTNVDPSKIADEGGPCVLRMQTAFLGLKLPPFTTKSGSATRFVQSYGSVTLAHELLDSTSGVVLLRYIGRREAAGGPVVASNSLWSGLTPTLDTMLSDLRQSLLEAVPLDAATDGPLSQCGGLIYKNIASPEEE
jgi:hypothetical protein